MVLTPQAIAALIADSLGKRVCLHKCFFFPWQKESFAVSPRCKGRVQPSRTVSESGIPLFVQHEMLSEQRGSRGCERSAPCLVCANSRFSSFAEWAGCSRRKWESSIQGKNAAGLSLSLIPLSCMWCVS